MGNGAHQWSPDDAAVTVLAKDYRVVRARDHSVRADITSLGRVFVVITAGVQSIGDLAVRMTADGKAML
jgi:hypothetical protein